MTGTTGLIIAGAGMLVTLVAAARWMRRRRAPAYIHIPREAAPASRPSPAELSIQLVVLFEAAVIHFNRFDRNFDGRITLNDLFRVQDDRNEKRPFRLQAKAMIDHWDVLGPEIGKLNAHNYERLAVYGRFRAQHGGPHIHSTLPEFLRAQRPPQNWPRPAG